MKFSSIEQWFDDPELGPSRQDRMPSVHLDRFWSAPPRQEDWIEYAVSWLEKLQNLIDSRGLSDEISARLCLSLSDRATLQDTEIARHMKGVDTFFPPEIYALPKRKHGTPFANERFERFRKESKIPDRNAEWHNTWLPYYCAFRSLSPEYVPLDDFASSIWIIERPNRNCVDGVRSKKSGTYLGQRRISHVAEIEEWMEKALANCEQMPPEEVEIVPTDSANAIKFFDEAIRVFQRFAESASDGELVRSMAPTISFELQPQDSFDFHVPEDPWAEVDHSVHPVLTLGSGQFNSIYDGESVYDLCLKGTTSTETIPSSFIALYTCATRNKDELSGAKRHLRFVHFLAE